MAYTTIDDPTIYFDTLIYTGNGSNPRTLTGLNFQPDWVWLKNRTDNNGHTLADSVRGSNKTLSSDGSGSELTDKADGHLDAFTSDGFTVGIDNDDARVNNSGSNYVAWNWLAGGSASSNSNGSITSSVSASTAAGFSVVGWTGNGSSGATIGHGLGVKPRMIISKRRDSTSQWTFYEAINGATKYMTFNQTDATSSATSRWNDTEPTASVFSVGNSSEVNGSSGTYIAYCFTDIKGYLKVGSYTGNGNADGAFVYTGFRPAFVITKRTSDISHWLLKDNKRDAFNVSDTLLVANDDDSESDWGTGRKIDFLSNGFKARSTSTGLNVSGSSYIYMAFAESPFVNSNGVPTNAR